MDLINELNLGTFTEMLLIALICYVVTQAFKKTKIHNSYMPWISMFTGIVAGLIAALIYHDSNLLSVATLGFLIGGATSGLFAGFKYPFEHHKDNEMDLTEVKEDD